MTTTTTDRKTPWIELDSAMEQALQQFMAISKTISYLWRSIPDSVVLDNPTYKTLDTATAALHEAWSKFIQAHGAFRRVMSLQDSEAAYKCLMHDIHAAESKEV